MASTYAVQTNPVASPIDAIYATESATHGTHLNNMYRVILSMGNAFIEIGHGEANKVHAYFLHLYCV